jgi:hypothetical protein
VHPARMHEGISVCSAKGIFVTFKSLGRSVSAVAVFMVIAAAGVAQIPSSQRIILVVDENSSYSDVMANMPWLVAQGAANGYATNYTSDNGGSLLDYLWLASGSCHSAANCSLPPPTHDFNCNGNDCYYPGKQTSDPITDDNIFRELNSAGISWKVYAESYTLAGGTVTTPDNHNGTAYYRRHNGATWYSDILSNVDGSASNVVDLSQLTTDLLNGNLPRYAIIVPDGNHDAHDCPVGLSSCTVQQKLAAADGFLSSTLAPILTSSDFQPGGDGLLIVTFDECAGGTNAGCGASVYAALIGPKVTPHVVSNLPYKHENALRTMLDALGITTYPGAAATAADMSDFFVTETSKPQVVVAFPASGASVSSPVLLQASAFPTTGHSVSGWSVYVDSVTAYSAGPVTSITPSLTIKDGQHTVVVRAWDTSGAFGDQTLNLSVSSLKPTVTISTPANNANVGSPVNVVASASPTAGHTVSGWWIYVDGVGVYSAGPGSAINTNVGMTAGTHTLLVRAWDTSGAYGDQSLTLTVSSKPAVAVSVPATGSNVISPINIQASALPSSGRFITGWHIYVDGIDNYRAGSVASINANLSNVSAGTHTVLVRAWDSSGAYGDQTLSLQVGTVAVNVTTPANSAWVNSPVNIQAVASSGHVVTGWIIYVDGVSAFAQEKRSSINANLMISPGAHSVVVRAWDSTSAYGDQTIDLTEP